MIPAPQPQAYQQPAQRMSVQPTHQLTSGESNRGWVLASGVHLVSMLSLFVLALVSALFEPSDYADGFSEQLFLTMQGSLVYLMFTAYVVTIASVIMALNLNCNKLIVMILPSLSHFLSFILWVVIMCLIAPGDDSFSDWWEDIFGEDFFEVAVPIVVSHVALCAGLVGLMAVGSNE